MEAQIVIVAAALVHAEPLSLCACALAIGLFFAYVAPFSSRLRYRRAAEDALWHIAGRAGSASCSTSGWLVLSKCLMGARPSIYLGLVRQGCPEHHLCSGNAERMTQLEVQRSQLCLGKCGRHREKQRDPTRQAMLQCIRW